MSVQSRFPDFLDDQRAFFDELVTKDWDSYISAEWDFVRKYEIRELFNMVQPQNVIDIGCGCGFHDREMAEYDFVTKVDGIDYSSASIAKANEVYPHQKVNRWVADIKELPPEAEYDLVVSFQVFEHVSDPDSFLSRCSALCRDGGHVAIFTPNRRRLSNIRRWLRFQKSQMLDPQHFREYTAKEIMRLGAKHGLRSAGSFGYSMHGLAAIDRTPIEKRIRLGRRLPFAAHGIAVVMQKATVI